MLPPGGPGTPARHGPAGGAVQESPLQHERLQPLGTHLEADEEERRLEPAVKLILGPHLAEPFNLLEVMGGTRVAVVFHIAGDAHNGHGAVENGPLVNGTFPTGRARGPKADFPVRSPAAVVHPPVDVARQSVNFADPPGAIGRPEGPDTTRRMASADAAVNASSASRLRIQSPVAAALAWFFVADHPAHSQSMTRAPRAFAMSTVPSTLPESNTTTSSANPSTESSRRGRLCASSRVITTTLSRGRWEGSIGFGVGSNAFVSPPGLVRNGHAVLKTWRPPGLWRR